MPVHIIIDGYNLVRQSTTLSRYDELDIQKGREALIELLVHYKKLKKHKITVVFDGTNAPSFLQRGDRIRGIEILFSRTGETADRVIKKMAAREKEKVIIVSSDKEIVDFSLSAGAVSIPSEKFESMVWMASKMNSFPDEEDEHNGWIPTTKKKGPRRRLSKKARKIRKKTKKL